MDATSEIGDFRRHPGCSLMLTCAMCGWAKAYDPERVIDRLRELKVGGYTTRPLDVARRVAWDCHRVRWRAQARCADVDRVMVSHECDGDEHEPEGWWPVRL